MHTQAGCSHDTLKEPFCHRDLTLTLSYNCSNDFPTLTKAAIRWRVHLILLCLKCVEMLAVNLCMRA